MNEISLSRRERANFIGSLCKARDYKLIPKGIIFFLSVIVTVFSLIYVQLSVE